MCTLKPPFDASSLHFLAMKIVKGTIPPISSTYSDDLRKLVGLLLTRDPLKRPTINQLLALPIMQSRIKKFLSTNQIKDEFDHTAIHGSNLFALAEKERDKRVSTPPKKITSSSTETTSSDNYNFN